MDTNPIAESVLGYPGSALLDQVSDSIVVVGSDGQLEYANPAAQSFGVAALLRAGQAILATARPSGQPTGGAVDRWWHQVSPGAGEGYTMVSHPEPAAQHRAEATPRPALHLEMIGHLSGGVAHDFNNLLTAILGSLELLGRSATEDRQKRWIGIANKAAQRGATLTQQLLSYARKQFMPPVPTDIPAALSQMTALMGASLGSRIQLKTEFAADTWLAQTDISQLELAMLNLMVNARTAMPDGGTLLLATHNYSDDMAGFPVDLAPGDYVVLTIADTGCGMDAEALAIVTQAFGATESLDKGGGRGVTQAYGFARQLGGTLRLTSTPGIGTVAEFFVPRAQSAGGALGRVLVVDPSAARRKLVADLLQPQGWVIDEAADSTAALERLAGSYAVMVLDLDLAGGAATQLARRARATQKSIGLVFLADRPDPVIAAGLPGAVLAKSAITDDLVHQVKAARDTPQ